MAVKASASVTLSIVIDVKATYRYYLLQSSTLAKPSKPTTYPPPSSWTDAEPTYTEGSTNSLYFVDCTVFCDDTFAYSTVSLSSAYEAAKAAYNKAANAQDTANSVQESLTEETSQIRQSILDQHTAITKTCEDIVLQALKSYTETGNFEEFKTTTEAQIALLADQLSLNFTKTIEQIETVNSDLQNQLNTITKYFTFDVDGMTIGASDSPFKVVQDNDSYTMYVNNVETLILDPDGNSLIPRLKITQSLDEFGYVTTEDEDGRVNTVYIGG